MDKFKRAEVVAALNSLEVIESSGGEEAYMLVENNKENHEVLNSVGISSEVINRYGDEETFCILALGFSEGYIDMYDDGRLVCFDSSIEFDLSHNEDKSIVPFKNEGEISIALNDGPRVLSLVLNEEQKQKIRDILA